MAKHRSKTPQDNCDLRIALLNRIAAKVSQDYYRAAQSDPLRHYAYAWFHGKTCIYVGKGGDADQWLEFLVNHKTENFDAHRYVMQHGDELEPFFVVSNVTETAAFAVEHYLIQHFKRKRDGGSLFNSKYESLPSLLGPENESVYDQRKGAERVVIPPNMRPMCKQQYAPMKFQNDQVITFNPDKYDARPKYGKSRTRFDAFRAAYKPGMTVQQYVDLWKANGWSSAKAHLDLRWDSQRGFITVK